jgi:hypothetical protein
MQRLALRSADDVSVPELVRELTLHDLGQLTSVRGEQQAIPLTRRMTMRHHSLAKCIAAGMSNWEAGAITGYQPASISVLKGDPAFKELVHFYKDKVDAEFIDIPRRLMNIASDALDLAHQKMEDAPEEVTISQAMDLAKAAMDRVGYGPSQTSMNIQVNVGDRLKGARERGAKARKMIDVTPKDA